MPQLIYPGNSLMGSMYTTKSHGSADGLVGSSRCMARLREQIERVAPYNSNVLIQGETGTGKELAAKYLHYESPRKRGEFVSVCCSSLCESLLESQLFGHERGSFTGASKQHTGYIEKAHKGTLFLDEISSASPQLQETLLRVLEEHRFERVGGYYTLTSAFRLVVATNSDLQELVARGSFREDLVYRLDVARIEIPSLRERKEDIPELAEYFLKQCRENLGKQDLELSEEARDNLVGFYWPGNVRELKNSIERASLATNDIIKPEHLDLREPTVPVLDSRDGLPLKEAVAQFERNYLETALRANHGNVSRTAETLQVCRKVLYQKGQVYGIDFSIFRD